MKKIFFVCLMILVASMVFANGSAEKETRVRIANIIPSNNEWNQIYHEAFAAQAEKYGYEAVQFDAQNDVQQQVNFVNTCVAQKFTAIVIQPLENSALTPALLKAHNAGVIVVSHYQMDDPSIKGEIYQLLFDQYGAGEMQAKLYAEQVAGEGVVGIIGGQEGAENTRLRSRGYHDVLDTYPGITIADERNCGWDSQMATTAAEDMITANPDLTDFMVMDDNMAVGVLQSIKNAGKAGQIGISTMGFYEKSIALIKDGSFMHSIAFAPKIFAIPAIDLVNDLLNGRDVDSRYIDAIPTVMGEPVTIENVDVAEY